MEVWIPHNVSARALGADEAAAALTAEAARRGVEITVIRDGSHGITWLEPLLETDRDGVRHAFGPVSAADIPGLLNADFADHPLALGPTEDIAFLARQTRLTFQRCGIIDPVSLKDDEATGGMCGPRRALAMPAPQIIDEVTHCGLRGRGGAGFPTAIKWNTVADAPGPQKYIVCNADEGDSGAVADWMLMEGAPYSLIEGMIIAGLATGADKGFIYLRSQYPDAAVALTQALASARAAGLLGASVLGDRRGFDIELRMGPGAYACGEQTSLLNSLEGKRGAVRARPPLPALRGFLGRPTVVNNVISLATVPVVFERGHAHYRDFGLGRSRGAIPIQIAGNGKYRGLYETALGGPLGDLVDNIAGGHGDGPPGKGGAGPRAAGRPVPARAVRDRVLL
jgi:formate dehydrogenase iron-sulfur subunit